MPAIPTGELAGLAASLCWAIGSLIFERLTRGGPLAPGATNTGKSLIAACVLFGAQLASTGAPPSVDARSLGLLSASAVVGISLGDTAFFVALSELGATRAILLLSCAPILAAALESLRNGALPPTAHLAGIALCLAGVALVLGRGGSGAPGNARRGLVAGLVAATCQATGALLSREATSNGASPLTASWLRLAVAVTALVLYALVTGKARAWLSPLRTPRTVGRLFVASFMGTVLGLYLSQVALAQSRSAGVASTLLATSPLFALPLAHLTGRERATPRAIAGVALAVGGIALLVAP